MIKEDMENAISQYDGLAVEIFSFGFKHGLPEDINMLFDVRFLPNPYWEEGMRHLTGQDGRVATYVVESESGRDFLPHLITLLDNVIGQNRRAEKEVLRIGIGCTGGQHRSVAVVERLAEQLHDDSFRLTVFHRDITRK